MGHCSGGLAKARAVTSRACCHNACASRPGSDPAPPSPVPPRPLRPAPAPRRHGASVGTAGSAGAKNGPFGPGSRQGGDPPPASRRGRRRRSFPFAHATTGNASAPGDRRDGQGWQPAAIRRRRGRAQRHPGAGDGPRHGRHGGGSSPDPAWKSKTRTCRHCTRTPPCRRTPGGRTGLAGAPGHHRSGMGTVMLTLAPM